MTKHEFIMWLDGYLDGAEKPSKGLIMDKARKIDVAPILTPGMPTIGPGIWTRPGDQIPGRGPFETPVPRFGEMAWDSTPPKIWSGSSADDGIVDHG